MAWGRIDDRLDDSPKIAELSDKAFRLFFYALSWSCRNRSNGEITKATARMLAGKIGGGNATIRELTRVTDATGKSFFEVVGEVFYIHDFDKYHPVDRTNTQRQKRYREKRSTEPKSEENVTARNGVTNALSEPLCNGDVTDDVTRDPRHARVRAPGLPIPDTHNLVEKEKLVGTTKALGDGSQVQENAPDPLPATATLGSVSSASQRDGKRMRRIGEHLNGATDLKPDAEIDTQAELARQKAALRGEA